MDIRAFFMKNEDAPVRNKRKHDCVRSFKDETEYSEITSEFDRKPGSSKSEPLSRGREFWVIFFFLDVRRTERTRQEMYWWTKNNRSFIFHSDAPTTKIRIGMHVELIACDDARPIVVHLLQ